MSSHNKASAYADQILRQLGMHDSYTVNKGDANWYGFGLRRLHVAKHSQHPGHGIP